MAAGTNGSPTAPPPANQRQDQCRNRAATCPPGAAANTRVHISVDPNIPGSGTALRVLVADLRRLPVQLSLNPGEGDGRLKEDTIDQIKSIVAGIDPERPVAIGTAPSRAIHVRIGINHAGAHIIGAPDGHGARLRRPGHPFPSLAHASSGLGAVLTGALLTGEVFTTVTALRTTAQRHIDRLDFCPVALRRPPELTPTHVRLERLILVGAGAIGTAVALILQALNATGELIVVDRQIFEPPNVVTYSLGTNADAEARRPKVDIVSAALPHINVRGVHGTVSDLIAMIDSGTVLMPTTVLGALDNIEARQDVQRIYADLTLDGGTGGRAGTTIGLHEAVPAGPCLRCYFPAATATPTLEQRLHEATGLPMARIARGDRPLTEHDLHDLSREGRELLQVHVGRPVCGLSRLLGLTTVGSDASYRPSAAFVAQQAACIMVGALIARTHLRDLPIRQVEYDALFGPRPDMVDGRRPRPGCYCQTHIDLIEEVRARRASRTRTH
jgi:molybdopterin/thiamine biosynthesis adenylyltransferase